MPLAATATATADKLKLAIAADPFRAYITLLPDLRPDGASRWKAKCPLHGDSNPSLTVYAKDAGWHCYGCQQGGDFLELVKLVRGCSFPQAVEETRQIVGIADEKPQAKPRVTPPPTADQIPLATVQACHQRLLADARALNWLITNKGLTEQITRLAQIGVSADHWKEKRYTIPSPFADGREDSFADVRGYKPGGDPKNLPWSAGRGNRLFPWPRVSGGRRFVVCEGEVDCLGLLARGVYAFTAHCGVDGLLSDSLQWPDLTGREFTILGDADDAGRRLCDELPARLFSQGAAKVTKAKWPAGLPKGFDVADWLATGPTDAEVWEALSW